LTGRVPRITNEFEFGIAVLAVFVTIATASLSYFLIEKRFISLGQEARW
jgi:peptidoglycan/LPS O-acetylase OafA/YrhL